MSRLNQPVKKEIKENTAAEGLERKKLLVEKRGENLKRKEFLTLFDVRYVISKCWKCMANSPGLVHYVSCPISKNGLPNRKIIIIKTKNI